MMSFPSPEAAGARAHVWRAPAAVVVRDALRAAEVLGQEVQLVHGGLEGQLVQALLRRARRLQGHSQAEGTRLSGRRLKQRSQCLIRTTSEASQQTLNSTVRPNQWTRCPD